MPQITGKSAEELAAEYDSGDKDPSLSSGSKRTKSDSISDARGESHNRVDRKCINIAANGEEKRKEKQ
uniref:Uncharacterized protein n=1 Tax=Arion vulgaris TaxID=1028688 RepID=A0A0B6XYD8_9EUPU